MSESLPCDTDEPPGPLLLDVKEEVKEELHSDDDPGLAEHRGIFEGGQPDDDAGLAEPIAGDPLGDLSAEALLQYFSIYSCVPRNISILCTFGMKSMIEMET